jgi:hypothetical protein
VRLTVPVLHDDTIMLRPPEAGDAAAITAAVQDPDIPRFTMVPSPYTVDDAVAYLEGCAARWSSGDAAPFVITDGATGTLLGSIGLHDLGVAMTGPNVGYWVAEESAYLDEAGRRVELPEPGSGRERLARRPVCGGHPGGGRRRRSRRAGSGGRFPGRALGRGVGLPGLPTVGRLA